MPFAQTTGVDVPGEISPFGLPTTPGPIGPIPLTGGSALQRLFSPYSAVPGDVEYSLTPPGASAPGLSLNLDFQTFVLLGLAIWAAAYIVPAIWRKD
jgi:hypothetical protein